MSRMINKIFTGLVESWIPLIIANIFIAVSAPFVVAYYDYRYFVQWYDIASREGLAQVYSKALKTAYFPLTVYVFVFFHWIGNSISSYLHLGESPSNPVVVAIDKIPYILSFNLIYFFLRRKYGPRAGFLWLINIAAYSTLVGFQVDLLVALFILLSMIYIEEDKPRISILFASLATLMKQVFAFTALIPFMYMWKTEGFEKALRSSLLYFLAPIVVLSAPFLVLDPTNFVYKSLLFHESRFPQDLSLWAIPLYLSQFNIQQLPRFLSWLWVIPFLSFVIVFIVSLYKNSITRSNAIYYYILLIAGMLVFNKVGGLNYLTWLTPLLAAWCARAGGREALTLKRLFISLPIFSLLIYPFLTIFAATIAGGDIFIVEDASWEPAEGIFYSSYGYGNPLTPLVSILKSSPTTYFLFRSFYNAMPYSSTVLTVLYNAVLIYYMVKAWKKVTGGDDVIIDRSRDEA
ncbi:hypothetical protein ACSU1N_05335 [Thermogladius sp. 4427co]|uniref:hypothetical protein n=1 Tax=Thermogladius sp. 4427co TaxID=3450718 RepID=UPI003F7AB319